MIVAHHLRGRKSTGMKKSPRCSWNLRILIPTQQTSRVKLHYRPRPRMSIQQLSSHSHNLNPPSPTHQISTMSQKAPHQSCSTSLHPSLRRSLQVPIHLRTPTPLPLILTNPPTAP
ncbi:hypothetical protein L873DRAFT_1889160 [Choiromyces venosus 120613-1]|uniref:Uncharacterized protein n=1 Tax=Choiromyces venosus 120613-1 TaxID=1336337 RepID=A0A3N4IX01_9PEZI|nr:hypothetical protein L873DRAFT_1889160 [Choiromyces venosus 120613-1]